MAPHPCYQGSNIQLWGSTHTAGEGQVLYHHNYFHRTVSVGAPPHPSPHGWKICWANAERIKTIPMIWKGFGGVVGMLLQTQHATCTVGASQGCVAGINPLMTVMG